MDLFPFQQRAAYFFALIREEKVLSLRSTGVKHVTQKAALNNSHLLILKRFCFTLEGFFLRNVKSAMVLFPRYIFLMNGEMKRR